MRQPLFALSLLPVLLSGMLAATPGSPAVAAGMSVNARPMTSASPPDSGSIVAQANHLQAEQGLTNELSPAWDAFSRAETSENGSIERIVYASPVNFKNESGEWEPIDTSLVDSNRANYAAEGDANAFDVLLPEDAGATPVRIEADDSWLSFRAIGANGEPQVDGSTITYGGPSLTQT